MSIKKHFVYLKEWFQAVHDLPRTNRKVDEIHQMLIQDPKDTAAIINYVRSSSQSLRELSRGLSELESSINTKKVAQDRSGAAEVDG